MIVHPPSPTGGRRGRVDGEILGLAHNVADVAEFLRRAGLEIDPAEVAGRRGSTGGEGAGALGPGDVTVEKV